MSRCVRWGGTPRVSGGNCGDCLSHCNPPARQERTDCGLCSHRGSHGATSTSLLTAGAATCGIPEIPAPQRSVAPAFLPASREERTAQPWRTPLLPPRSHFENKTTSQIPETFQINNHAFGHVVPRLCPSHRTTARIGPAVAASCLCSL